MFTRLDPESPSKEFYFSISINEADIYESSLSHKSSFFFFFFALMPRVSVDECQPEVPSQELLNKLNTSNNLSVFVSGMRKQFQEYVAKTAPPKPAAVQIL